ncbi:MAG: Rod shape-determining protein MreD [Flammeovirgaceae bacterium]|nr:MAG: Rod shape-determining protein MreD [Flammeovirgaceae bacterium]
MNRFGIFQGVLFFVYLLVQVMLFKNAVFFHTAFCFFYLGYLLRLPVETNHMALMGVGFVMGFLVDLFYDSLGLHTLTCVLIMYLRPYWLSVLTPQGGYDSGAMPGVAQFSVQWFLVYAVPLALLHHSVLFFTEAGGFDYFWLTAGKITASILYTLLVLVMVEVLFAGRKR